MPVSTRDVLSRIPTHDISAQGVKARTPKCAVILISSDLLQGSLAPTHNPRKSCVSLVMTRTCKRPHSPSQITIPNAWEAPAQHPDMLAMLQELDREIANWGQCNAYHKRSSSELRELDTLTVRRSKAPASYPPAQAKSLQSVGSPNHSAKCRRYNHPCESPITSLPTADPVVQQPRTRKVSFAPLPSPSPPSGMKAYLERKHSNTVPAPRENTGCHSPRDAPLPSPKSTPSGVTSLDGFFKKSRPNAVLVPKTASARIPRIWRNNL